MARLPYVDGLGWAAPGRAWLLQAGGWLVMSAHPEWRSTKYSDAVRYSLLGGASAQGTFTADGRAPVDWDQSSPPSADGPQFRFGNAVFDVPATGVLTWTASVTFIAIEPVPHDGVTSFPDSLSIPVIETVTIPG